MPGRYSTRRRGNFPRSIVTSIKNVHDKQDSVIDTIVTDIFAKAVTAPAPTVTSDIAHGSIIKSVWISLDFCGTLGSGVSNSIFVYMMKNPGNNLTPPSADAVGSSNEKKFVFKQWTAMAMRIQDGPTPYHWEGWIKIPKRYQRMGTDDTLSMSYEASTAGAGLITYQAIYKWYR